MALNIQQKFISLVTMYTGKYM